MQPDRTHRARALVQMTLQLTPFERGRLLEQECAGDPQLMAEVTRLLEPEPDKTATYSRPSAQRSIGRYLIENQLGSGAMGVVYLATDPTLGRKVAIKSILATGEESGTRQHFLMKEAKAAAALTHPNIAAVHDVLTESGNTYVVMEYISGSSVAAMIAALPSGRTLPPATTLKILQQAASALDYAHSNGVIHRDIKPANLLVDQKGNAKIVDFGIAKLTNSDSDTTWGGPVGTVAYMSPEQINDEPLSGQTDQFSLAVTAYVLFTGRPMFPVPKDIRSLMYKNCLEEPVAPSQVKFGLPQFLDAAIARGLAKAPAARFPSCTAFAAACIETFAASEDQHVPTLPVEEPMTKPRTAVWAGVAAAAVLAGGLLVIETRTPEAPPPPVKAQPKQTPQIIPTAPVPTPKAGEVKPRIEKKVAVIKKEIAKVYAGPDSGQFIWTGTVPPDGTIVIAPRQPELTGDFLPGVPVLVEVVPPVLHVVGPPSPSNRFVGLTLKNDSQRVQTLVLVKWSVKK